MGIKKTACFDVVLRPEEIVHVHVHDRVEVDIQCQQEMPEIYWEIAVVPRPFVYTAGEFISITQEAQQHARDVENDTPVVASALVVKNIAQKLMADFYYKFDPLKKPLKVVKKFDRGVEWLKTLSCYKELQDKLIQ